MAGASGTFGHSCFNGLDSKWAGRVADRVGKEQTRRQSGVPHRGGTIAPTSILACSRPV